MEQLLARRQRVRELIASFRDSDRRPFPMWEKDTKIAVPGQFDEMETEGRFV